MAEDGKNVMSGGEQQRRVGKTFAIFLPHLFLILRTCRPQLSVSLLTSDEFSSCSISLCCAQNNSWKRNVSENSCSSSPSLVYFLPWSDVCFHLSQSKAAVPIVAILDEHSSPILGTFLLSSNSKFSHELISQRALSSPFLFPPFYGAHSLHHYCRLSSLFFVCSTFARHYRCESLRILTWLNNEASLCELEDKRREFSDFRFRFLWGMLASMCMCAPRIEHRPHAALKWRRQRVDGSRLLNNEPLFFIIMAAKAESVRATKRVDRMIKKSERKFRISEHTKALSTFDSFIVCLSFPFRSSN